MSNSDCLKNWSGSTPINKLVYTLFPQDMNYAKLGTYKPADEDLNLWALLEYWIADLFKFGIIDLYKDLLYLGFPSELFWNYSATIKSYYKGSPSSSSNVGYDFDTNRTIYFPTIRQWYDLANRGAGLTTFVSTYIFAGGGSFGSTMSQAFLDSENTMRGVISYDILPFSSPDHKETLIRKLLFDLSEDNFDYFMILSSEVNSNNINTDEIISNLANMVYAKSTDSTETK